MIEFQRNKRTTISALTTMFFFGILLESPWVYGQTGDLQRLESLVTNLQNQLQMHQQTMEKQAEMIRIQGEEIANLKNNLETAQAEGTVYLPRQDKEAFREQVWETLNEFRLSEREEVSEEKQLRTIYDDGFYLKGRDDTLKIGGWWQGDVNIFEQGHEGNTRFRTRRVRLDIRGVLEDYFEYRLYTQFAGASANLQEAWLAYKYFPNARLKVGQFKVPFSLESQYSARWIDFVERSIGVTNLQPAEDLGVMLFGNPFDSQVEYAVGVFNGRLRTRDDNNDGLDLAARVVLAPFQKWGPNALEDFYIGGSITNGHSDETLAGTSFTSAGGTGFLTYASAVRHAANRFRFGGEVQWIYGPGDIKAEFVGMNLEDVERTGLKDDIQFGSWYVSGAYLLTGEKKIRNKPVHPKNPFSIKDGGWGAWEAKARYEQFLVDREALNLGLLTGTRRADAISVGLNWWPNHHLRFMLDYVLTYFSDSIAVGSELEEAENMILGRVQYNF